MKKKLKVLIPVLVLAALAAAFFLYTGTYYHADETAVAAVNAEDPVRVSGTGYGWFFDGPSEDNLLVFYPGAKVEETAYAPLMRLIAARGVDVCLVKMPFRLAFFGAYKADDVFALYAHENRYIGGHSLGGAMAAAYAAERSETLQGVILLAAYPTKPLADGMWLLSVYGSEDGVLNMQKVAEGRQFAPARYTEFVLEGGNHAGFGNYGAQKGDGEAVLPRDEQQARTADLIARCVSGAVG
ncbi:MAG: alpha/beta hydrolase [Clostridia bacterium]|nr:alpha/beta hydrolase [Clostridia bacterium]